MRLTPAQIAVHQICGQKLPLDDDLPIGRFLKLKSLGGNRVILAVRPSRILCHVSACTL